MVGAFDEVSSIHFYSFDLLLLVYGGSGAARKLGVGGNFRGNVRDFSRDNFREMFRDIFRDKNQWHFPLDSFKISYIHLNSFTFP